MAKLRSVIIGATGLAGQQFIAALKEHPQIQIAAVAASPKSAGKSYRDALKTPDGMVSWFVSEPIPDEIGQMKVLNAAEVDARSFDIAFSAV